MVLLFLILAVADRPVSFKADVAPILAARCVSCHNEKKPANGLDITTFARLRKGGKGAGDEVIVPGDPEASELVAVLRPDANRACP